MSPRTSSVARGGIRTDVVRRIVRTIGEAREIGDGEPARRHLLAGVMRDLGAAVGAMVVDGDYRLGAKNSVEGATLQGFDTVSIRVFTVHETRGSSINPYHAQMISMSSAKSPGSVVSATLPKRAWDRSTFANEYTRPAGLEHFVGAIRVLGAARCEGITMMRERDDRPFTRHDHDVLAVYMHEGPRFFAPSHATLQPRLSRVLDALQTGASEKQIAAQLGLSPHTVHQYVKELFRRYRVHSRMELVEALRNGRLSSERRSSRS